MATARDAGFQPVVPWSAEELSAILDHVPSSIGVWDADLLNEYFNAAAYDALAITADVRGRRLVEIVGARTLTTIIDRVRRAQAGERQQFSRVVLRADGREEHYDVEYIPIPSADGTSTSIITIGVDVSAQVTADVLRRDVAPFLAAVREREQLAGQLEDSLAAALNALAEDLTRAAGRTPSIASAVTQAAELCGAAVEQLHTLLHRRTRVGSGPVFAAAAEQVVQEAGAALGFAPVFALRGPVERVRPLLAGEILAVLGEALSNVARHAAAGEVIAAVSVTSDHVSVTIADDGRGLGASRPGGGMANLRARAVRLGGTCDWQDGVKGGTLLEWRVPLGSPPAGAPSGGSSGTPPLVMPVATHVARVPRRSIGLDDRRLLQVLDELSSVILVWDTGTCLEFANAAGISWLDAGGRAEVLGRSMIELLPADTYYATRPFVRSALAGEPQQFERRGSGGEGHSPVNIRVMFTPRVGDDGAVDGFVAQIFDISGRLQAQDDLRRSMEQMTALEERRRIAEDLHDIVIQHLFAAGLRLDGALQVAATDRTVDAESVSLLHESVERVDHAIARLRESIAMLRTPPQPSSSPG